MRALIRAILAHVPTVHLSIHRPPSRLDRAFDTYYARTTSDRLTRYPSRKR